ncbi:FAD-dependent oxidoreductase [Sphingomonas colocasiae]|uniref:FAD-dependent oxidoreductase n=1 Tax=Sphingomonas colocasiae TaxID=1848973 RepID=A0ABS7PWI2_9SPHN|nr:FAD-dependent oxidoreductase [Sphingomonas colocasiae]MBY8824339.1 FAD-dependent oxidoreductase [Sphingomonas colocasiae]
MLRESGTLPETVEVLVLGAGIAGHCAALAAAEAGAQVLLLEKSGQPGGSSAMAGGGFAFSGTDLTISAGQDDSLEAFRRDLFESGQGQNSPALIDRFLENQLEAYAFLKAHGVKFEIYAAVPRIHTTGTGRAVTNLHVAARAHPCIQFFSKTSAMRLHRSAPDGPVDRATVFYGDQELTITATRGIVLATGGFSRSREMLRVFAPELLDAVKHGGVANTGDGLMMATMLGAGLADIGHVTGSFGGAIRNYPHGVQGADEVPPLIFAFQAGGIIVNRNGQRFINEDQSYKTLSPAGMKQPGGIGFQIFDEKLIRLSLADSSVNNYAEALHGDYLRKADTIPELAARMGLDADALQATIARYNADVVNGTDGEFGRVKDLIAIDTPPYYIAATANALTSTYGGITTDGGMQVIDWLGEPIPGLFAAGEVVGGFHGAGYYSASSLSSSATFGMCAGRAAAGVPI